MPVEFKDYYAILGVDKKASAEEIKKAFRKLARTCHPDLAKETDKAASETRFKEINEAYEVLKDPEKRAKYDQLGMDWDRYGDVRAEGSGSNAGFGPRARRQRASARPGYEYHFGGTGFSDFFERFFGGAGMDPFSEVDLRGYGRPEAGRRPVRGHDVEAELMVTLEEALKGATRRITLDKRDPSRGVANAETLSVSIPAGVREGQRIRLAGQGQPSPTGGEPGDLFLKVRFAQHPYFAVKDSDLHYTLKLAPWEAALGETVAVPTLEGSAKVRVKPGTQGGRRLRLSGHGLPKAGGGRGDLIAAIDIRVPEGATEKEKELWRELRAVSTFNPRES